MAVELKGRVRNNRTTYVTPAEVSGLKRQILKPSDVRFDNYLDRTIHGDMFDVVIKLPDESVDVLFIDPP